MHEVGCADDRCGGEGGGLDQGSYLWLECITQLSKPRADSGEFRIPAYVIRNILPDLNATGGVSSPSLPSPYHYQSPEKGLRAYTFCHELVSGGTVSATKQLPTRDTTVVPYLKECLSWTRA